mmetsp:Transcript_1490/g.161  ORF Transcript_1490/g.161 Transcript_1490/m.161 type:complete len:118 (+) Transcript_1490:758-1111(+)
MGLIIPKKVLKMNMIKLIYHFLLPTENYQEVLLIMKMKEDMNVGIITLLLNITMKKMLKLLKMLLMVIEVILYVDPILFINLYLCMVLFVVLFTLLTLNLKHLIVVKNLCIYLNKKL